MSFSINTKGYNFTNSLYRATQKVMESHESKLVCCSKVQASHYPYNQKASLAIIGKFNWLKYKITWLVRSYSQYESY